MKHSLLALISIFIFTCFFSSYHCSAQSIPKDVDSVEDTHIEIQKIKEQNELNRIKDSLRLEVMREELSKSGQTKLEELERYKNELEAIKRQDSLRYFTQTARIDSLRQNVQPAYVTLFNDTLFPIYAAFGPFNAHQRAQNAKSNVFEIYNSTYFSKDSIIIDKKANHININYGQSYIISSISEDDAIWANVNIDSLAASYQTIIIDKIEANRYSHNFENSMMRWLKVATIIIVFFIVLKILNTIFRRYINYLLIKNKSFKKGIKIRQYELISPRLLKRQFIQIVKVVRFIFIILITYLSLSLIFSVFPRTKDWAFTLWKLIYDPLKDMGNGFVAFIPDLIKILVIIFIARFINRLLRYFSYEIQRNILKLKGFHRDWAGPTYKLLRFMVYVFAFILIFPMLPGADTQEFKGVTVFLGVLLSLGSTSAISNTIAGFIITYMRPFSVGDWIKVNDITGEVIEKTALVTRLRTINNEEVTVPNSSILSNHTINYSSSIPEKLLCISTEVNIRYDVKWEKVEELLIQAALGTMDISNAVPPYVFQLELKENYVVYQLNAMTKLPHRMYHIRSELNQNIQAVFRAHGIEIIAPAHVQIDKDFTNKK